MMICKTSDDNIFNSLFVSERLQTEFHSELSSHLNDYLTTVDSDNNMNSMSNEWTEYWKTLLISANIRNTLMVYKKYQNILIVPTFRDDKHESILTTDNTLVPNIAPHLYPIINKKYDTRANLHVAFPTGHNSFIKFLMEEYDVDIIESNKNFTFGDNDYSITTDMNGVEFDAVLLLGVDEPESPVDISEVKNIFQSLCVENFDVIDDFVRQSVTASFYNPDIDNDNVNYHYDDRVVGDTEDLSDISSFLGTAYATFDEKDYDDKSRQLSRYMIDVVSKGYRIYA